MKSRTFIPLGLFALGLALTLVVTHRRDSKPSSAETVLDVRNVPGISEGETAALPKMENLSNEPVSLAAGNGRHLFLIAFSSQCQGCERDAHFWRLLAGEAKKKRVDLYLISIDNQGDAVRSFIQGLGLTDFPVLYDRYGEATTNLKLNVVPQYLLLTDGGRVLGRWTGLSHFNSKREKINDPAQMFRLID